LEDFKPLVKALLAIVVIILLVYVALTQKHPVKP
jgi:hypothetical protein